MAEKGPQPGDSGAEVILAARRLEAILDSAQDAIVGIDQHGEITLFNPSAERIFGYSKDEVLGRNVSMLMPSPYREEHDGYIHHYHETGVPGAIGRVRKVHGRRKNGEIFPIELSVSAAPTGVARTYAAIIRDVTERATADEAIRLSEARFEAFMANAPTMAFLRDDGGRHVYVNRVFERFFRISARDLTGKTGEDSLPSGFLRPMRSSDVLVSGNRQPLELLERLRGPDGKMHDWLFFRFAVELAPDRLAVGGVGIEVTSGRRAERRLQLQLDLVRAMAATRSIASDPPEILRTVATGLAFEIAEYWVLRPSSKTLELARAWSAPDYSSNAPLPVGGEREIPVGTGLAGTAAAQRRVVASADLSLDPKYPRPFERSRAPLHGACAVPVFAESTLYGVLVMYRKESLDVDEEFRSLLETVGSQLGEHARLEHAERRVEDLHRAAEQRSRLADIGAVAARIVHDLGNPIAGMKLNAQLLVRAATKHQDDGLHDSASQVLASLGHLTSMLHDLKDFARSQRLERQRIDAGALARDVADHWAPVAAERGIRIRAESGALPPLELDPERIRRVLDNLVKNAIEATPTDGEVVLHLMARPDGGVSLCVEDEGCGVPEDVDVFRLFESTKPQGSGLGLSIAREIVEAHGGSLRFERRKPKGTAFYVDLPQSPSPLDSRTPRPSS